MAARRPVTGRELARFLREHREKVRPSEVGLPATEVRRTPGLRREEVAGLASISPDYYAKLEQGRSSQPSARILDAVAEALQLNPADRHHLFSLAGMAAPRPRRPVSAVRPDLRDLLHRLSDAAVLITNARYDAIVWNPLADALLGDVAAERNLARRRFLRPTILGPAAAREVGSAMVARLRRAVDRYPRDEITRRLLTDLRDGSAEFAALWDSHPAPTLDHRAKVLDHPEVGPLDVHWNVLAVPENDQEVIFITAEPGSAAARALRRLRGPPG